MHEAEVIVANFPIGEVRSCTPLSSGIVHASYLIDAEEGRYVLQRMNKVFEPSVLLDMKDVTEHLTAKGFTTFSLIETSSGELSYFDGSYHWRLLTHLDGTPSVGGPTLTQLTSAGRLIGQFHTALLDYDKPIRHKIPGFHDTKAYLAHLKEVDEQHVGSDKHAHLHPLTEEVLEKSAKLPSFDALPTRTLHGDPKIENVLFKDDEAIAIIDLDTVGRYRITTEVGDMLRSWTKDNSGEKRGFSAEKWHASLAGYRETAAFMTEPEWDALPDGLAMIALELSARFVTDAYEESYFTHDATRYPSLYEQNLHGARANLSFLKDFEAKRSSL